VSMGLYFPVLVMGAAYAGFTIAASMLAGREQHERSERMRDLAFGSALVAAAYTAILVVLAAVDAPSRFTDAVTIILVICGFFAILLVVFFLIAQVVGRLGRRPGA
jgi:Kef-type K+ transport system membrane component KefB